MKMPYRRLLPAVLTGLLCTAACPASEPLAPILACRTLADPPARLACFDRESAKLVPASAAAAMPPTSARSAPAPLAAPAPVSPPAPAAAVSAASAASVPAAAPTSAAPVPSAIPASTAKENFGLSEGAVAKKEVDAGARPKELSSIDAHIVSVSVAGVGLATFTLDNGQVWRQLSPEGDLLAKPGEPVTVSRGVFRSYWLQTKSGRGCKVTRIV
jgi:lipoprotein-anchoring transpeptidase ErfK/SrfK